MAIKPWRRREDKEWSARTDAMAREDAAVGQENLANDAPAQADWFGPSDLEDQGYAARSEVSLAAMLMLGEQFYQRIDGIGLARKALEAPLTGDQRRDLTVEERALLANGRAWCMLVHGDLGHYKRRDDPFVLADAERSVEMARSAVPASPRVVTTVALLRLRQGRVAEALESARRAVDAFARLADHERSGEAQGAAILALVTLALATAAAGDPGSARLLGTAARAVRTPLDLDDPAFGALMSELDEATTGGT